MFTGAYMQYVLQDGVFPDNTTGHFIGKCTYRSRVSKVKLYNNNMFAEIEQNLRKT